MRYFLKKFWYEGVGAIICLVLGMASGYYAQGGDSVWYKQLAKPFFQPPAWVFGPVWTVLYVMMGIILGKVWKERPRPYGILCVFALQLALNMLWSTLFFRWHRLDYAVIDIAFLWIGWVVFMALVRGRRSVFWLSVPYILWVSFAFVLALCVYVMNG